MGINTMPEKDAAGNIIQNKNPFTTNATKDGVLYAKIHGLIKQIEANGTEIFKFEVPYDSAYFQGIEVLDSIISISDLYLKYPDVFEEAETLAGTVKEQYGYSVNLGNVLFREKSQYAAKVPKGFVLECEVQNRTAEAKEFAVNLILHEIRAN